MKRTVTSIIILVLATILFLAIQIGYSKEKTFESAVKAYKPTYFLFGNKEQQMKLQVSIEGNLFYPANTGLFLGYTQLSHWIGYKGNDTFYTMYQPEIFYRFKSGDNIFNNS